MAFFAVSGRHKSMGTGPAVTAAAEVPPFVGSRGHRQSIGCPSRHLVVHNALEMFNDCNWGEVLFIVNCVAMVMGKNAKELSRYSRRNPKTTASIDLEETPEKTQVNDRSGKVKVIRYLC